MKILCLILSVIAWSLFGVCPAPSPDCARAENFDEIRYALINEGAELRDGGGKVITSLPSTYFVAVTAESPDSYFVSYLDLEGYVEKTAVEVVDYEPVTKYASPAFTADNDTHPVNIRSTPTKNGTIIDSIPDGESGIYYGNVTGDELIPTIDSWYYVRYGEGSKKYGYVYSPQVKASPIADNVIEKVTQRGEEKEPSVASDALEGIFIAALCIPAVIIMLIIFRGEGSRRPRHMD